MKSWWSLDLRSLALFRIVLGLLVLLDLAIRLTDLRAFYTDWGACPRDLILPLCEKEQWSLHMASGQAWFELLLFALHGYFAGCLLVGYKTRRNNALTWLMLLSLHNRNPAILDSGDQYLRMMLFWGLFLPLGRRWSLDARSQPASPDQRWFGPGMVGYALQLTLVYTFAATFHSGPCWRQDGTAVYLALSLDQLATPRAAWLLAHPQLMQTLTFLTLGFEFLGPLLIWLPAPFRFLWCLSVAAMHLGFGTFLHLGVFALTGAFSSVGLLPSQVWDGWKTTSPPPEVARSGWQWTLVALLLVYLWLGNRATLRSNEWSLGPWSAPGYLLGLDQYWGVFSPSPPESDGWIVVDAHRFDQQHFDLFAHYFGEHTELTWEKPRYVASTYPNARWRKFMLNLETDGWASLREGLARYLSRRWNTSHSSDELVADFQIYYLTRATPPQGQPQNSPIEKHLLWTHQCFDVPLRSPDDPRPVNRPAPQLLWHSVMKRTDY